MSSNTLTLTFLGILTSRISLDLCDPVPKLRTLLFGGVLLLVLVEQNQQVNAASAAGTSTDSDSRRAFLCGGRDWRHALFGRPESRDHRATLGIAAEVVLDQAQNLIGAAASELVELPRESAGLDEYHNAIVPQCGITAKLRRAGQAKGGSIHFGRI